MSIPMQAFFISVIMTVTFILGAVMFVISFEVVTFASWFSCAGFFGVGFGMLNFSFMGKL